MKRYDDAGNEVHGTAHIPELDGIQGWTVKDIYGGGIPTPEELHKAVEYIHSLPPVTFCSKCGQVLPKDAEVEVD